MNKKKMIAIGGGIAVLLLVIGVAVVVRSQNNGDTEGENSKTKSKVLEKVNDIPQRERPYVTLRPLTGRNDLEITVYDRKIDAEKVEVTLEYDRNKGVLDAVLKTFALDKDIVKERLFMGSKSAGGHITFHDDVVGGRMVLDFTGGPRDYALEVPWRYQDTEQRYSQLSTADGRFQVVLEEPIKANKVIVMLSPGLPAPIDAEVLAGPYLVRTVGDLLKTPAEVKIRLLEEDSTAKLVGWDGDSWENINTTIDGKTLMGTSPFYEAYIATE